MFNRSAGDLLLPEAFERFCQAGAPLKSLHLNQPDIHQLHAEGERILRYGTFELDFSTHVIHCSEGIYHLLEYPSAVRPQITLERYLSHVQQAGNQAPEDTATLLQKAGPGAPEYTRVYRATTYAGNQKWIQVWGRRSYNEQNQPLKDTGIIRDITQQYEQEEDARRNLEELQRSNRELEDFAYVASHDLQEPLRKISTFCGRLFARYHDQLDREGGQYLDRIMASADNMRNLIQNLLDYSRISQTEEALQPTRLDVLLIGVQSDLELIIEETRTQITVGPLPVVMGNAALLTQLFTNLFTNAIKFRKADVTPEIQITAGTPTPLELAAAGLDARGLYHCIHVSDNGIGFDPAHAERIFQVFQRLHGKSEFPGTGIGLAICRKIAERHGGALTASGEERKGARFTVYFPAHQDLPA